MINNEEDIVVYLGIKVFISDTSYLYFCNRNAQVTVEEKPPLKKTSFSTKNIDI